MNRSFCNRCGRLVRATHETRDGRVFLVKHCDRCGDTETLCSGDARRYHAKRSLDHTPPSGACTLQCPGCRHVKQPNLVFIDITNRCNLNCPICINNTPTMGFLFEPPLEYFEKILDHFARQDPKPSVQLFGGEPTVRRDLPEIVRMAKDRSMQVRVVTNGIRLADPEYCRELVAERPTLLIAYDGRNPRTYGVLRGNESILEKKVRGIDNVMRLRPSSIGLMTLVAKGFNEGEIAEIFAFCHERRRKVRAVYFMPLAHTWDDAQFHLEAERTTAEDLERLVAGVFPGEQTDFIPAGLLGQMPTLARCLAPKPLPFLGAHPNCESLYLLFSDGERYVPIDRYLKPGPRGESGLHALARTLIALEGPFRRVAGLVERSLPGEVLGLLGLRRRFLEAVALGVSFVAGVKHARVGRFFQGRGPMKLLHALAFCAEALVGVKSRWSQEKHTLVQGVLQLIILPFEDRQTLETERLERCPTAFAYYEPWSDRVAHVPTCAWGLHKTEVMRRIADHYAARKPSLQTDRA